jgi:hypothetical protein
MSYEEAVVEAKSRGDGWDVVPPRDTKDRRDKHRTVRYNGLLYHGDTYELAFENADLQLSGEPF